MTNKTDNKRMEDFFEFVINHFHATHRKIKAEGILRPDRLNVYIDWITELLVIQVYCLDQKSNYVEVNTEPNNEDFKLFLEAYKQVEQEMKVEGQKTDYSDVIHRMEHYFLDYVDIYGYDRNVRFTIMYIPLEEETDTVEVL